MRFPKFLFMVILISSAALLGILALNQPKPVRADVTYVNSCSSTSTTSSISCLLNHPANVVIIAVLGYQGVNDVPLTATVDGVSMNTLRYQQGMNHLSGLGTVTVNVTYSFIATAGTSSIAMTFPAAGSESLVVYSLLGAQSNFANTNTYLLGSMGELSWRDTLHVAATNGMALTGAACVLESVGATPLNIVGMWNTVDIGFATTTGGVSTFTQGVYAGHAPLSISTAPTYIGGNVTTTGFSSSSYIDCAMVDMVVLPVTSLSVLNQLYDSCAAGSAYPSLATQPYPSSRWTVVLPDGGQFVFWQNCQGGIEYMESWSYVSNPSGPFTFVSDFTQTHLLTQSFTFSNGVVSPDGSTFTFDYVFASGPDELSVCAITSSMTQLDQSGFHSLDNMPADSCSRTSYQTLGHPVDLNAVNLPDGSTLIGDMEQSYSTYYANVYQYAPNDQDHGGNQMFLLKYWYNSVPQVAITEYVDPFAYYVVTGEGQKLVTTLYQASGAASWVPNGTTVGTTRSSELTSVAADSQALYIAGFDGRTIFVTVYNPHTTGTLSGTGDLQIDTINALNYNPAVKPVPVDIHITTHGPPVSTDGVGAHLYFQYKSLSDNHFHLGAAWTQDYGSTWGAVANALDVTTNDLVDSSSNAQIPSLNDGGRASSPEVDRITISALNNTLNGFNVNSHYISLPSLVNLKYVSSVTSTNYYLTRSTTETATTIPLSPDVGSAAFLQMMMMWMIVALPAAAFSMMGFYSGGGRAGVTLMIIGAAVGLVIGMLLGYWPNWILFFVVLAIVVMYLRSRSGGGGAEGPAEATLEEVVSNE
jgi:hypothetical protein